MEGYFSAVRKMEQTVMFPSLLRGVSLEENVNPSEADTGDKDLYEYYTLLKSIKEMAEGDLVPLNSRKVQTVPWMKEQESEEEADLEGLFHYHVTALTRVLNQLARQANTITSKYNEIMGQINQSDYTLRW